jgi:hypothetical protein
MITNTLIFMMMMVDYDLISDNHHHLRFSNYRTKRRTTNHKLQTTNVKYVLLLNSRRQRPPTLAPCPQTGFFQKTFDHLPGCKRRFMAYLVFYRRKNVQQSYSLACLDYIGMGHRTIFSLHWRLSPFRGEYGRKRI